MGGTHSVVSPRSEMTWIDNGMMINVLRSIVSFPIELCGFERQVFNDRSLCLDVGFNFYHFGIDKINIYNVKWFDVIDFSFQYI